MNKKWIKTNEGRYVFAIDDKTIGQLEINLGSMNSKAKIIIDNLEYTIKRTGFWKSAIQITDEKENIILKMYSKKWFAGSYILEYKNKKFKLIHRNNPLAEYVIIDDFKTLLTYGLVLENKKYRVKITSNSNNNDVLLDFLMWYLFAPIASEHNGDEILFFLMLTA